MSRILRFTALSLLCCSLWGCPKQVPLDEDMNARRAAIATAREFFTHLEKGQVDAAVALTREPFWLDGEMADREQLSRELRENLDEINAWHIIDARFFSKADMNLFAQRMVKKMRRRGVPNDYYVVVQFREHDDNDTESILMMLEYVKGQWRLAGLDD